MTGSIGYETEWRGMSKNDYCFSVYILASVSGTLYVGVTNTLVRRVLEHREGRNVNSFTHQYQCRHLVYHDESPYVLNAIEEEKRIKNMSRLEKEALIRTMNPQWNDLAKDWP